MDPGSIPRCLASILLGLLVILNTGHSFCEVTDHTFDPVKNVPESERVVLATTLYKTNLRKVSPNLAMGGLNSLLTIARNLDDKPLQCAVFDMRADYYAVNKGFNPLSTAYYQQAIDFAVANNLLFEKGLYLYKMGEYYDVFVHNASACRYFLRAQEIFSQEGYANIPDIGIYLSQIARFYYGLGDYENAKQNLQTALLYLPEGKRDKINSINTIGLIYRNYREFPQALRYFNQALNMAVTANDTAWVGIAKGNIGSVYFLEGQYARAIPYITTDYTTSIICHEPVNGAIALLRLIKINIDTKHYDTAYRQLQTVERLTKATNEDVLGVMADYYNLKSQLYEQLNQPRQSIAYRKIYEIEKDSLIKRNDVAAVERVKLRWEIDKRVSQLNKLKADEQIRSVQMEASIAVLLLLVVIIILIYNRQRLKNKKDKELLLAQKRILDEELKSAATALNGFTQNLKQKNALIEKFRSELDRLSRQSEIKENAGNLDRLLQAHIMTDENWVEFKKLFSRVYPGFFVNLTKNHPHLSATDVRMLALLKLGLSNAEMANMLGITVEGIKKAKQRLRKKIGSQSIIEIDDLAD